MKLILIVEDEYGNAEVLQLLLEAAGFRVVVASNGKSALELLAGEKPALILSDFMMPFMTGAELGLAVRADGALRDIPFVFMSATNEEVVRSAFKDYDAFIVKPFDADLLERTVEKLATAGRVPAVVRDPAVEESMRQLLQGIDIPPAGGSGA